MGQQSEAGKTRPAKRSRQNEASKAKPAKRGQQNETGKIEPSVTGNGNRFCKTVTARSVQSHIGISVLQVLA